MPKKKNSKAESTSSSEPLDSKAVSPIDDVAKPGETPSSPTSRPVIAGHGSMIKQDPMVSGSADTKAVPDENDEAPPANLATKKEITISPASEDEIETDKSADPPAENKEKTEEELPPEAEEAKTDEPPQPAGQDKGADKEDDSGSDSAAINSLAGAAESKKLSAKAAEEEQARQDKIKELAAGRKYFIPIVEGGHKASSQRFMSWLLLVLLVASVGVYLAIDAGYLNVGIVLPFDIIKN